MFQIFYITLNCHIHNSLPLRSLALPPEKKSPESVDPASLISSFSSLSSSFDASGIVNSVAPILNHILWRPTKSIKTTKTKAKERDTWASVHQTLLHSHKPKTESAIKQTTAAKHNFHWSKSQLRTWEPWIHPDGNHARDNQRMWGYSFSKTNGLASFRAEAERWGNEWGK